MTNIDRRLLALNIALVLFVAGTTPAYAYLDPGSGSMMVQLLLGGVAGAVVIVRLYWARLLTWLGLKRDKTDIKTSH